MNPEKDRDMVDDLLAYKAKIDSVVQHSFNMDSLFINAVKVHTCLGRSTDVERSPPPRPRVTTRTFARARPDLFPSRSCSDGVRGVHQQAQQQACGDACKVH